MGDTQNSEVTIKEGVMGPVVATLAKTDVVNCQELRGFWISWSGQVLRVGTGVKPYENEMLQASGITVPFTSVSVATYIGTTGYWVFTTGQIHYPGEILSILQTFSILW